MNTTYSREKMETIRQQLETKRNDLLAELENEEGPVGKSRGQNPDRTDLANEYLSQGRRTALRTMDQETLLQVERALERIENGTYGRCVKCNEYINPERLEILPHATLCIQCQTQTPSG